MNSYAAAGQSGAGTYAAGTSVTVRAGSRDGFVFTGWTVVSGGVSLSPDALTATAKFTMPKEDVTVTANWEALYTVIYHPGERGIFAQKTYTGLRAGTATPAAPAAPGEAGWRFTGWSPAPSAKVSGSATYVAQWEQIAYTVTYMPGLHGIFREARHTGLVYGQATPAAPATQGEEGWVFKGWSPSRAQTVTGNATYTALWAYEGGEDPPPVIPPPVDPPVTPPTDVVTTTVDPPRTENIISDPAEPHGAYIDAGIPIISIGGMAVPLIGLSGDPVWALVNLILCIAGAIIAAIAVIRAMKRRKEEEGGFEYQSEYLEENEEKRAEEKNRREWLVVAIIMAVAGIVLFLLTEDMRNMMVLLDRWTIANAIIFVILNVAIRFAFKRKEGDDEEKEAEAEFNVQTV
jgi:uncharacterized repeat protein (TIGR02543 family)